MPKCTCTLAVRKGFSQQIIYTYGYSRLKEKNASFPKCLDKMSSFSPHLIGARRVAGLGDPVGVADLGVRADVPEDAVHAPEAASGADGRVVVVGQRVEEGDAAALLQDLVVGGGEEAVGQAVPGKRSTYSSIFTM